MHLFRRGEAGQVPEYLGPVQAADVEIRRSPITGSTVRQITKVAGGWELAMVTFFPGQYGRQRKRHVVGVFKTEQEAERGIV